MSNKQEIIDAIDILFAKHVDDIDLDKLQQLYTFLVKSAFPVSDDDLRKLFRVLKKQILSCRSQQNFDKLFSSIAISMKLSYKFLFDNLAMASAQRKYGTAQANRAERVKLIKDYVGFCLPLVIDNHEVLTLVEAIMTISSLVNMDMMTPEIANKIIGGKLELLDKATNLELYQLIDVIVEVNQHELGAINKG